MPRKVFVAGEILTAADVNTNLMDQAVMVFDDSTARGSAIPSPSEGMVTYLKDTDALEKYTTAWEAVINAGLGTNVVQTVKTDTFTTNSATFTPVTGMSASITPTDSTSKVLVIAQLTIGGGTNTHLGYWKVTRGGTDIYIGDAASNRIQTAFGGYVTATVQNLVSNSIVFLDSPATTSATTYQVEARRGASATSIYLNRTHVDTDNADNGRGASSIALIEVAA